MNKSEPCGLARTPIDDQLAIARTRGRKAPIRTGALQAAPSLKDRMRAFSSNNNKSDDNAGCTPAKTKAGAEKGSSSKRCILSSSDADDSELDTDTKTNAAIVCETEILHDGTHRETLQNHHGVIMDKTGLQKVRGSIPETASFGMSAIDNASLQEQNQIGPVSTVGDSRETLLRPEPNEGVPSLGKPTIILSESTAPQSMKGSLSQSSECRSVVKDTLVADEPRVASQKVVSKLPHPSPEDEPLIDMTTTNEQLAVAMKREGKAPLRTECKEAAPSVKDRIGSFRSKPSVGQAQQKRTSGSNASARDQPRVTSTFNSTESSRCSENKQDRGSSAASGTTLMGESSSVSSKSDERENTSKLDDRKVRAAEPCGTARTSINDQLAIARKRGRRAPIKLESLRSRPSLKDRMKAFS